MKKIKYPDYANSTVSLANSILKYFGAPVHHETLGLLDWKFAEREYENVVVILLDGMGKMYCGRQSGAGWIFCFPSGGDLLGGVSADYGGGHNFDLQRALSGGALLAGLGLLLSEDR